jgi:cellulose biosynthesis protein BcsQ
VIIAFQVLDTRPSPLQILIYQNQLDNVGYLNYLGSIKTYDKRFTREIKSRIAMANAAFNNKPLFTTKPKLNLSENVVKCCTWITRTSLNGAETWSLWTTDKKYLVSFEM